MLELDGVPVAGGIGMWSPDELSLYLVGMDVEAMQYRPGWLFNIGSIRMAIQAGVSSFNFLRGDEEYKGRLGAEPTVQQRWLATSPRWVPRLRGAALKKGIEVRDWFRNRTKAVDPDATSQSLADANT
jgi:CelD/BcsL family acetyltransferase involved in cellulose biosynthesis